MSLDCGKKPQYSERTHAGTGRMCELHTERPGSGSNPRVKHHCTTTVFLREGLTNQGLLFSNVFPGPFSQMDMSNISLVWDVKRSLWCVWLFANAPLLSFSCKPGLVRVKSPPFIQINKAGGAASFMCRRAGEFKPRIKTSPRQWCMFCLLLQPTIQHPTRSIQQTPSPLCVLTTSLPRPFHFF